MDTQRITLKQVAQKLRRRDRLIMKHRLLVLSLIMSLVGSIVCALKGMSVGAWMLLITTLALEGYRRKEGWLLISRREPLDRYRLYIKDE